MCDLGFVDFDHLETRSVEIPNLCRMLFCDMSVEGGSGQGD